jgi:hypothetical protein
MDMFPQQSTDADQLRDDLQLPTAPRPIILPLNWHLPPGHQAVDPGSGRLHICDFGFGKTYDAKEGVGLESAFEEENCSQLTNLLWLPSARITANECAQHLFFESVRSKALFVADDCE